MPTTLSFFLLWEFFLAFIIVPAWSWAQVGLRTSPLTAPKEWDDNIKEGTRGGLLARWPLYDVNKNHSSSRTNNNIESSLAAIFRGVAYGHTTVLSTTTTSTTTTTTTTTAPPYVRQNSADIFVTTKGSYSDRESTLENTQDLYLETQYNDYDQQMGNQPVPQDEKLDVVHAGGPEEDVEVEQEAWVHDLGVAWIVHVYCAAGLYSLLALLSLVMLSRIRTYCSYLLPCGHYVALHLLTFLSASLRCLHLFHDPYGSHGRLPRVVAALVAEVGWPCLTAALAIVVVGVIQVWPSPSHQYYHHHHYAPLALALITLFHLLVFLGAHILANVFPEHEGPLRAAARAATAGWGGVVGVAGCLAMCKLVQAARDQHHKNTTTITITCNMQETTANQQHRQHHSQYTTQHLQAAQLVLIVALTQMLIAALHLYGLLGPHYVLHLPPAHPWPWFVFHTSSGFMELLAWVLLVLVSLITVRNSTFKPPLQHNKTESWLLWVLSWFGCCKGRCLNTRTTAVNTEVFPNGYQTREEVLTRVQTCDKTSIPSTFIHKSKQLQALQQTRPHNSIPLCKPPLRSTASDIYLWQSHGGAQDTFPPSGSRPSSIVLSDAGFIRFKNPDPQATINSCANSFKNFGAHKDMEELSTSAIAPPPGSYGPDLHYSVVRTKNNSSSKSLGSPHCDKHLKHNLKKSQSVNVESEAKSNDRRREGEGEDGASTTEDGSSSTEAVSPTTGCNTGGDALDWSKYTSTCSSSVSAANSFDIRMYDDSDVAYYQIPFSVYNSLHQHSPSPPSIPPPPPPLPHRPHHSASRDDVTEGHQDTTQQTAKLRSFLPLSHASSPSEVNSDLSAPCPRHLPTGDSPDLVASATAIPCPQHVRWDTRRAVVDPQCSIVSSPGPLWSTQSAPKAPDVGPVSDNIKNIVHVHAHSIRHTDDALENSGHLPQSSQAIQQESGNIPQTSCVTEISESSQQIPRVYYMLPQKLDQEQQICQHHRRRSSKKESDRIRPCGHFPSGAAASNTNREDSIKQSSHSSKQNNLNMHNSPTVYTDAPTVLLHVLHQQQETSHHHQILDTEECQQNSKKHCQVLEKNLKNLAHHSLQNNCQEGQEATKKHRKSEKHKNNMPEEKQSFAVPQEVSQHFRGKVLLKHQPLNKIQDPQIRNLEETYANASQQQEEQAGCKITAMTKTATSTRVSSASPTSSHSDSSQGSNPDLTMDSVSSEVSYKCTDLHEIHEQEQSHSHSHLISEAAKAQIFVPAVEPLQNHHCQIHNAREKNQQVRGAAPEIPPRKMYGLSSHTSGGQVRDP